MRRNWRKMFRKFSHSSESEIFKNYLSILASLRSHNFNFIFIVFRQGVSSDCPGPWFHWSGQPQIHIFPAPSASQALGLKAAPLQLPSFSFLPMDRLLVYLKWKAVLPFQWLEKPVYVPLCFCRVLDQKEDGCVVDMQHFNSGAQSVLAYATVNGSLVGWDLRSSSNAWTLKHDLKSGLITSFAVDIHQCWLCIGKPTAVLGHCQHLQAASWESQLLFALVIFPSLLFS